MEGRPSPNQSTNVAPRLNVGPAQSRYSTKTCQLWPGGPHFTDGKTEAQRREAFGLGPYLPYPALHAWAPCPGPGGDGGVGSSPRLPWKEVMMLKK